MKIAFVIGTRPEAIKLAPVVLEAQKRLGVEPLVIATGQHKEMLAQAMSIFDLTPDLNLEIMTPDQTLAGITTAALAGLNEMLEIEKPDWIVVQGDTSTTFCGALAAFYQRIPVAHVEAGLRTGNIKEPFPEEANRCMTTRIADLHFAPTQSSRENLLKENVNANQISVTGNTAIDALLLTLKRLNINDQIASTNSQNNRMILVTAHRRENHGPRMESICHAILEILHRYHDVDVVFPMHLSPKVRAVVTPLLSEHPRVKLTEPMDYLEFVNAMQQSYLIISDSGGVQEEAPTLGKPVLVLRDQTERPEATQAGTAILVGADRQTIVKTASTLLDDDKAYTRMASKENPYGDGLASARILDTITSSTI